MCEVIIDRRQLKYDSKLSTYDICWMSRDNGEECWRIEETGRKVAGVIRSVLNARVLRL